MCTQVYKKKGVPRSLDPLAAMNNQDRISPYSINKNQAG